MCDTVCVALIDWFLGSTSHNFAECDPWTDGKSMALQLRERAKGLESELGQLQAHIVQCEHVARAHEMTVEKLKGALRDKVNREERVSKRDAEAYSRLKRAFVSSKGVQHMTNAASPCIKSRYNSLSMQVGCGVDAQRNPCAALLHSICTAIVQLQQHMMQASTSEVNLHSTGRHGSGKIEILDGRHCR